MLSQLISSNHQLDYLHGVGKYPRNWMDREGITVDVVSVYCVHVYVTLRVEIALIVLLSNKGGTHISHSVHIIMFFFRKGALGWVFVMSSICVTYFQPVT